LAAKIINGGRCCKCLGSTRLVEVRFFSIRNLLCKKSANFVPSKSINLKSYRYDASFYIGIDWN